MIRYMKRRISAMALAAVTVTAMLTSCEKEGNMLFRGYYSFKTSGVIEVERTMTYPQDGTVTVDTLQISLASESGQMNILSSDDKAGEMFVTMNVIGGDAVVLDATTSGTDMTVGPNSRVITFLDGVDRVTLNVAVNGSARKYEDVVIFDLDYSGEGSVGDPDDENATKYGDYVILASSVKCVAKEND